MQDRVEGVVGRWIFSDSIIRWFNLIHQSSHVSWLSYAGGALIAPGLKGHTRLGNERIFIESFTKDGVSEVQHLLAAITTTEGRRGGNRGNQPERSLSIFSSDVRCSSAVFSRPI